MNKAAFLFVLVLLLALAVPLCIARGPQGPRTDEFIDAPYTTIPPEEPATEATPEAVPSESPGRYGAIQLTDAETDTLARVIWLEARGAPFEGQQAVAEVVFNRMLSPAFPDTLDEVIYQEGQFSAAESVQSAEPTEAQYIAISTALSGPSILPLEVVFFSQKGENDNVWGTIGGYVFCYPYCWEGP